MISHKMLQGICRDEFESLIPWTGSGQHDPESYECSVVEFIMV